MQLSFVSSCGFNIPRVIIDGVDDIYLIRNTGSTIIHGIGISFDSSTSCWYLLIQVNIGNEDILFKVKLDQD